MSYDCTQDEDSATLQVDIPDGDKSGVCFAKIFQYSISSYPTDYAYFANGVVHSHVFLFWACEASISFLDLQPQRHASVSVIWWFRYTSILKSVSTCWSVTLSTRRCNTWVGQGVRSACPRSWLSELLGIETLLDSSASSASTCQGTKIWWTRVAKCFKILEFPVVLCNHPTRLLNALKTM
jgi:hypothetical protein